MVWILLDVAALGVAMLIAATLLSFRARAVVSIAAFVLIIAIGLMAAPA
jgi:hypothetical protein